MNIGRLVPLRRLEEDGRIGQATLTAIGEFQRRIVGMPVPDLRIDPNGRTLTRLREAIPGGFTEAKLSAIMTNGIGARITTFFGPLQRCMQAYGINTPLRMAHFLAQIGHESGDLRYTEEVASGDEYEGRGSLGNTQPGDGRRFKGRGLIQLTGRANYTAYSAARRTDYVTPENCRRLSTDPEIAADVSGWFWSSRNLNRLADADDLVGITLRVNGGLRGLEERRSHLIRAKCFLVR